MAKKADLISAVNTWITAVITYLKHRSSMLEVINELYPSKVTDSNATETYTTKNGSIITYGISIVKQGRSVRVNGSYVNASSSISLPSGTTIFTFKNNEYRGDTSPYLGTNAEYTPAYIVRTLGVLLPSETRSFSIIINADL